MLEIGGGIGQVMLELLRGQEGGVRRRDELLPVYEPHVRELASEAGSPTVSPFGRPISLPIRLRALPPTSSS